MGIGNSTIYEGKEDPWKAEGEKNERIRRRREGEMIYYDISISNPISPSYVRGIHGAFPKTKKPRV